MRNDSFFKKRLRDRKIQFRINIKGVEIRNNMVSASFSVEKFSLLENRGSRHNDISSEICFLMFLAGLGVGIERIVVMEWRKRIRIGNPKRFTGMLTRLCHTHYGIKLGILQKNLDRCI